MSKKGSVDLQVLDFGQIECHLDSRSDQRGLFFAHLTQAPASFCHSPKAREVRRYCLGVYQIRDPLNNLAYSFRRFSISFQFGEILNLDFRPGTSLNSVGRMTLLAFF